jgi:hypothetical protein
MGTKYGPVFEDDAADLGSGIPEQTDEEAANEAAMNSPAERARRNVSDAENQIRANAVAKLASKAAPVMDEEAPTKMPVRPGQASSGAKTPMVTKEQLAASGLSLRDYLNKQQGLTRRGESASAPARMPTPSGQQTPMYSNEGRNKPRGQGTAMEQAPSVDETTLPLSERIKLSQARMGRGSGTSDTRSVNERIRNAFGMKKGGAVKKMASGGSVSSASKRADGIAVKGKTRGKMC